MRIGMIGAGHIGSTLAKYFIAGEHQVALSNSREPESLRELAEQLGENTYVATPDEAANFGDIVVVAVPFSNYDEVPTGGTVGKPVIDATNYDPRRDGHYPELDNDSTTSSEMVQAHLPYSQVVKAFNAMRWDHLRDLSRPGGALTRYGIPLSGDDNGAKLTVIDLIDDMGFEPVDAGGLAQGGRKHQPGSAVFIADLTADDLRDRLPGVDKP